MSNLKMAFLVLFLYHLYVQATDVVFTTDPAPFNLLIAMPRLSERRAELRAVPSIPPNGKIQSWKWELTNNLTTLPSWLQYVAPYPDSHVFALRLQAPEGNVSTIVKDPPPFFLSFNATLQFSWNGDSVNATQVVKQSAVVKVSLHLSTPLNENRIDLPAELDRQIVVTDSGDRLLIRVAAGPSLVTNRTRLSDGSVPKLDLGALTLEPTDDLQLNCSECTIGDLTMERSSNFSSGSSFRVVGGIVRFIDPAVVYSTITINKDGVLEINLPTPSSVVDLHTPLIDDVRGNQSVFIDEKTNTSRTFVNQGTIKVIKGILRLYSPVNVGNIQIARSGTLEIITNQERIVMFAADSLMENNGTIKVVSGFTVVRANKMFSPGSLNVGEGGIMELSATANNLTFNLTGQTSSQGIFRVGNGVCNVLSSFESSGLIEVQSEAQFVVFGPNPRFISSKSPVSFQCAGMTKLRGANLKCVKDVVFTDGSILEIDSNSTMEIRPYNQSLINGKLLLNSGVMNISSGNIRFVAPINQNGRLLATNAIVELASRDLSIFNPMMAKQSSMQAEVSINGKLILTDTSVRISQGVNVNANEIMVKSAELLLQNNSKVEFDDFKQMEKRSVLSLEPKAILYSRPQSRERPCVFEHGKIIGTGLINCDSILLNTTLSPGFSPGTIQFSRSLRLLPSSRTTIEVLSNETYDKVIVGQSLEVSGTLRLMGNLDWILVNRSSHTNNRDSNILTQPYTNLEIMSSNGSVTGTFDQVELLLDRTANFTLINETETEKRDLAKHYIQYKTDYAKNSVLLALRPVYAQKSSTSDAQLTATNTAALAFVGVVSLYLLAHSYTNLGLVSREEKNRGGDDKKHKSKKHKQKEQGAQTHRSVSTKQANSQTKSRKKQRS